MSNEALITESTETTEVKAKRKGGRPANPNNMSNRAKIILASIPTEEFKKDTAVKRLVEELGCKESSAMTFYYTFKAAKSKAEA